MARKVLVTTLCDRCAASADNEHPGVKFSYRGHEYVIDLCGACFKGFDAELQAFIAVAERAEARSRRHARERIIPGRPYLDSTTAVRSHRDPAYLKSVRAWARENGWPLLAERGRIPADAEAAFKQAQA
jgi:hypothetical protein